MDDIMKTLVEYSNNYSVIKFDENEYSDLIAIANGEKEIEVNDEVIKFDGKNELNDSMKLNFYGLIYEKLDENLKDNFLNLITTKTNDIPGVVYTYFEHMKEKREKAQEDYKRKKALAAFAGTTDYDSEHSRSL